MLALVENRLYGFQEAWALSAVHGLVSVHAVANLRKWSTNVHHLAGHYSADGCIQRICGAQLNRLATRPHPTISSPRTPLLVSIPGSAPADSDEHYVDQTRNRTSHREAKSRHLRSRRSAKN